MGKNAVKKSQNNVSIGNISWFDLRIPMIAYTWFPKAIDLNDASVAIFHFDQVK